MTAWTPRDEATNAAAVRNLANLLERWQLTDPHERAEHIATTLTVDGYKPAEYLPAQRGPGASRTAIDAAITACEAAVAASRAARIDQETTT